MTDSPELAAIRARDIQYAEMPGEFATAGIDRRALLRMLDEAQAESDTLAADNDALRVEIAQWRAERDKLAAELETERMRLAACGVAALGYFDGCKDEYRSASLEDTLRLEARVQALEALAEWCKPDESSPPEHWAAYHAAFGSQSETKVDPTWVCGCNTTNAAYLNNCARCGHPNYHATTPEPDLKYV